MKTKKLCCSRFRDVASHLSRANEPPATLDKVHQAHVKWKHMCDKRMKFQQEAELTKQFWETTTGKLLETLRIPERRLIRESKTNTLSLVNSGIFSSHIFVLFNDIFVHINGTSFTSHRLQTVWIDPLSDTESLQVNGYFKLVIIFTGQIINYV